MLNITYFRKGLAIFLLFFLIYPLMIQTAFGAVIILDDFNSYTDGTLDGQGGWTGSSLYSIQATTTYEGAKAVKFPNPPEFIDKDITPQTDGIIGFYLRNDNLTDTRVILTSSGTNRYQIQLDSSGDINFNGSTAETLGTYTLSTWYYLEIEIDATGNLARGRYDGGTWSSWLVSNTGDYIQIDNIQLFGTSSGVGYYDYLTYTSAVVDVYGCMDIGALNYNPLATIDDGSCEYPIVGLAFSIPTSMATTTLAYFTGFLSDPGMVLVYALVIGLPLGFYVMRNLMSLFFQQHKGRVKK